jgi:hypothetical protein
MKGTPVSPSPNLRYLRCTKLRQPAAEQKNKQVIENGRDRENKWGHNETSRFTLPSHAGAAININGTDSHIDACDVECATFDPNTMLEYPNT